MRRRAIYLTVALAAVFFATLVTFPHDDHDKKSPSPTPQAANTASNTAAVSSEVMTEHDHANMPDQMKMAEYFPNYHPLVVHFPIVLIIIAALFQVLAFLVYKNEFSFAAFLLLVLGTLSVWLASNTFHAHAANLPEPMNTIFEEHELLADFTWWLALAALAVKAVSHFYLKRKWWSEALVLALLIAASITVSIAGHHGAQLVHMGGVGPKGQFLESH